MAQQDYAPMDAGAHAVATSLAPQLGTDTLDLGLGRFDMRRLTVIERDLLGVIMYATIRGKKHPTWNVILDVLKNWGVSVGGRGRRDIIRMEAVAKGGPASVSEEMRPPNWLARNLYDTNWEEKQREEQGL